MRVISRVAGTTAAAITRLPAVWWYTMGTRRVPCRRKLSGRLAPLESEPFIASGEMGADQAGWNGKLLFLASKIEVLLGVRSNSSAATRKNNVSHNFNCSQHTT